MTDPTITAPVRKGRGCFFYGCLTSLVLLLVILVMAFLAIRWVRNQISSFTAGAPMQLPKVEMADTEYQALKQRVETFGAALNQEKATEPLLLTERELNALITRTPSMKELSDKVYVSLKDNQVRGQVSIPLSGLGWLGRGRYLNGEATFNVSLQNGVLVVTADAVQVQGRSLPEALMKGVRQENLAKELYKDPKDAAIISRLDSVQVQDGRAVIKPREAK
jgi:hypothetical protein